MKAQNKISRPSDVDPEFLPAIEGVDVRTLTRNWWAALLRGIVGIIFGLVTFFAPGISLGALVLVFGAYALADGVLAVISPIRARVENERWWMLAVEGLVGIAAGVINIPLARHNGPGANLRDCRVGADDWRLGNRRGLSGYGK